MRCKRRTKRKGGRGRGILELCGPAYQAGGADVGRLFGSVLCVLREIWMSLPPPLPFFVPKGKKVIFFLPFPNYNFVLGCLRKGCKKKEKTDLVVVGSHTQEEMGSHNSVSTRNDNKRQKRMRV